MQRIVEAALQSDRLIDITTRGRKTSQSHRIEIAFHNLEGKIYISGLPGTRDWFANLVANPQFTFHLKQSTQADLPAVATPVQDEETRRRVLSSIVVKWGRQHQLEEFVELSPLVEVRLEGRGSED